MELCIYKLVLPVVMIFSNLCLIMAHDKPIIGVLAMDLPNSNNGDMYIMANYVKFLMMAGARVVPINGKEPESYYKDVFKKINGLLLPGGGADTVTSEYAKSAKIMYNLAIRANDKGDYFPMFGICLGSQTLVHIVEGQKRRHRTPGTGDIGMPLTFTAAAKTSRLFRQAPKDLINALKKEPITYNYHKWGFNPTIFNSKTKLGKFFTVLSTNKDSDGKDFVSTYEAKKYPIYGTQWHPEKANFEWDPKKHIKHSPNAIKTTQYFANFFVEEARKSSHKFDSVEEEATALIQNYNRRYFTSNFYEAFYFTFPTYWRVKVWTSKVDKSGTDARVFIVLYGTRGNSRVIRLDDRHNNFETGKLDTFIVTTKHIGELKKLKMWHDNSGRGPGWRMEKVEVKNIKSGKVFKKTAGTWVMEDASIICERRCTISKV